PTRPTPKSTLFPYTTLFRSCRCYNRRRRGDSELNLACASVVLCGRSTAPSPELALLEDHGIRQRAETLDGDLDRTGDPLQVAWRSEEHTSELQSREKLVCRL